MFASLGPLRIGASGLLADPDRTAIEVVAPDAGRAFQPAGPGGYGLAAPREHSRRQGGRGAARGGPQPGRVRPAEGGQPGDLEGALVDDAGRPREGQQPAPAQRLGRAPVLGRVHRLEGAGLTHRGARMVAEGRVARPVEDGDDDRAHALDPVRAGLGPGDEGQAAQRPLAVSSSPSRYFQSMRARTASAACRSGRFSRNWSKVTRASRHGGRPGWPRLGNRSAKSVSAKTVPSSSRSLRSGLPLRKAALATRAVPSGTGSIGLDLSDMVGLRRGGPAAAYPSAAKQPTSPTVSGGF